MRSRWRMLVGVVVLAAGLLTAPGFAHAQRVLRSPYTPRTHEAFKAVKAHAAIPFARIRHAGRSTSKRRPTRGAAVIAQHRTRFNAQVSRTESERR